MSPSSTITKAGCPVVDALPSGLRINSEIRSASKLEAKDREHSKRMAWFFKEGAQVIVMPFSLEDLERDKTSMKTLEKECERLRQVDAQVMSALFVDNKREPILAYCASRPNRETPELDKNTQYQGRTQTDLNKLRDSSVAIRFDGLSKEKQELLYLESQALCADVNVHTRKDRKRHGNVNFMDYAIESNPDEGDVCCEALEDRSEDGSEDGLGEDTFVNLDAHLPSDGSERAGVAHLVHGWIQQNQPTKGLYVSGDISRTSTSLAAVPSYFLGTRPISLLIGAYLEVIFPRWYELYNSAFAAGCMFDQDPGPFLGRAIVYKLQGKLHKDGRDAGPSVSFGVGNYEGGEIYFPQLGAKLRYGPGEMCFSFSSLLGHWVGPWLPGVQTVKMQKENVTPGRIGTVFFFPKNSLQILANKPPLWAATTAFGAKPYAMKRRTWEDHSAAFPAEPVSPLTMPVTPSTPKLFIRIPSVSQTSGTSTTIPPGGKKRPHESSTLQDPQQTHSKSSISSRPGKRTKP